MDRPAGDGRDNQRASRNRRRRPDRARGVILRTPEVSFQLLEPKSGVFHVLDFLSALYLQLVLGYSPLQVGLSFLPGNIIMGVFSISLSAKLVMRFGTRLPLATGLLVAAVGLALFARAPVDGSFVVDVLPSMILLGIGAGIAFNPVLLAAMSDVAPEESGLASGVVNTAFMMGGALGLAVLASIAAARNDSLLAGGSGRLDALTGGYHLAFLVGALFAVAAATVGALLLREGHAAAAHQGDELVPAAAESE